VGVRLLELSGEREAAAEWPVKYARIGLPYIGPLAERLREFEADRTRYPALLDFYPRLIEEIETLARAGAAAIPFQASAWFFRSGARIRSWLRAEPPGAGAAWQGRWKDAVGRGSPLGRARSCWHPAGNWWLERRLASFASAAARPGSLRRGPGNLRPSTEARPGQRANDQS
jgi:hypothetical protein